MPGSEGERQGAMRLAKQFERAGLNEISISEFEIPLWERDSSSLTVSNPVDRIFDGQHEVLALPGSPCETVSGELVDVGYGLPEDFQSMDVDGKIALVSSQNPPDDPRTFNRMEKYTLAEKEGASGFAYYNTISGCVTPTGAIGFGRKKPGTIPAIGVSHELSCRITRWLDREGPVKATLSVSAEIGQGTSHNVEAVTGPDCDKEVLVTAHVDSHDIADGTRDNAAGCALIAEIGRLLTKISELGYRIRLIGFGSEEIGLYGSSHWAKTHDLSSVAGVINLDGIGFSRDLKVVGVNSIAEPFADTVTKTGHSVRTTESVSAFNDGWSFAREGVPIVTCRSFVNSPNGIIRYGNLEWGHTHADTLDKIDKRDIHDLAIQIAAGTVGIAQRCQDNPPARILDPSQYLATTTLEYFEQSDRQDRPELVDR
jgi:Zn-dependent M28 family amino/carboxypeptidase